MKIFKLDEQDPLSVRLGISNRALAECKTEPSALELAYFKFTHGDHTGKFTNAVIKTVTAGLAWFTGRPPCAGWWSATTQIETHGGKLYRHFDGEYWSFDAVWVHHTGDELEKSITNVQKRHCESEASMHHQLVRPAWDVDEKGYHPFVPSNVSRCPVEPTTKVQVVLRSCNVGERTAGNYRWTAWMASYNSSDIVAYKVLS